MIRGITMKTMRMTTAQAVVRFLSQQYVARDGQEQRFFAGIFGIFGHGNVSGLGQALEEVGQDLRYYQARNEQAMAKVAAAYAKMKNRLQAFASTSSIGPGATNMVTGAAVATVNRLPVLLLPGDIFASRQPQPVLQQLEYPGSQDTSVNDCFRPVSKYWDRINRPEQVLASLPEADLVIAVGTRLSDFTTASKTAFQHPDVAFVGINTVSMDAYKLGALPLVGDARATLAALTGALREAGYHTDESSERQVRALKEEWNAAVDAQRRVVDGARLTQANVIGLVNEASGPRDIVVCAAGGLPGDLLKLWRPLDPKGYHLEYGYSCMGYEIAGGLGVKMADPSREVFVMVGDGSYLMLNSEIVTSLQEGYKLTIVLVDNSGFQCIRGLQMSTGSPAFGNEFRYRDQGSGRLEGDYIPIDFVKNAQSLGARAYYATSRDELRRALAAAARETQTVLIHVPVDVDARVPGYEGWWDVPVAEVSAEAGVQSARKAYEDARQKQRFFA